MKFPILIKLFVGIVLFATLVALYVLNVPNCDHLKQFCEAALIGLGVMHLGSEGIGGASPDKQGGAALPGFLAAMGLGTALMLTGCATSTPQQVQTTYVQACSMYLAGFTVAAEMRQAGKLSKSQIDQITLIDNQITPLCTGPLPTDATAATQQITAAVTTLTILEAIKP